MKLPKWIKRKKTEYEKGLEPKSLAPSSMAQEMKAAGLILGIFFGGIIAVLGVGKYLEWDSETFMLSFIVAVALDMLALGGYAIWQYFSAISQILFDREFGYTPNLRVRHEIYCSKEHVRQLIGPKDNVENLNVLEAKLKTFITDEKIRKTIMDYFVKDKPFPKYLTYFSHKRNTLEGWDDSKATTPAFTSHAVFHDLPGNEQWVFAKGQDNWYGNIYFNHPLSESDNVKVIAWTLDPFSNEPMPICVLLHSSIAYGQKQLPKKEEDVKVNDALQYVLAQYHGMTESYRKDVSNLRAIEDSKLHDVKDISEHGHRIAKADTTLFKDIMEDVKRNWLHAGWFKVLVTIAFIAAAVIIIALVLHWINLGAIFGGG